jgi:hypothetical protein
MFLFSSTKEARLHSKIEEVKTKPGIDFVDVHA